MARIFRDNLNVDSGWKKTGAWVDSTKDILGGSISLSGGTSYKTKSWTKTGLEGLNVVLTAEYSPSVAQYHQLHVRASASNNFLLCYQNNGNFYIGKTDPGLTAFSSVAIIDYDASKTYIMELLVFGDMLMGTLYDSNGDVNVQLIERSATISGFTGTKTGFGAATIATYTRVAGRVLNTYYNIVCFGDSNTSGLKVEDWEAYAQQIQKKRKTSDVTAINAGIGGDKVQDLIDRQATDLDPFFTSGAKNIAMIFIGTNDASTLTAAQSWANMQTLITAVKAAGWIVFMCTYPHSFGNNAKIDFINDLEDLVSTNELAEGYTLVDLYIAFGCADDTGNFVTPGLQADGDTLHFSPRGHRLVARECLKQIRNNERIAI